MDVSPNSMSSKTEKKGRGGGVLLKLDQVSDLVYYSAPQSHWNKQGVSACVEMISGEERRLEALSWLQQHEKRPGNQRASFPLASSTRQNFLRKVVLCSHTAL